MTVLLSFPEKALFLVLVKKRKKIKRRDAKLNIYLRFLLITINCKEMYIPY